MGTEKEAVDMERRTETAETVRTQRRKASQDVVNGYRRRKEKEEPMTPCRFQAYHKGCRQHDAEHIYKFPF